MDGLLEEYIRVINAKDSEITKLIRENEKIQLDARRSEDKYRSKLVAIKNELDTLQTNASLQIKKQKEDRDSVERLTSENSTLKDDLMVVRDALRKSDEQLQSILKTSSKAQRHESHARERLESELRQTRQGLEEKLMEVVQRNGQLEALLATGGNKVVDAEKDLVRWKVEAQRLQHDHAEQHKVIKELKRRLREAVPKELAESEALQIEERHRSMTQQLEKECTRLRDTIREEGSRAGRAETALGDTRKRLEDAEHELVLSRRQFEEMNVAYAQSKLHYTSTIEDLRKDAAGEIRVLREQLEKERYARVSHEGEIVVLRQRLADAETSVAQQTTRTLQEQHQQQEQERSLKMRLQETLVELDSVKRTANQNEDTVKLLRSKCSSTREEMDIEVSKLKSEITNMDLALQSKVSEVGHLQNTIYELKGQLQASQGELVNERLHWTRRETEFRNAAAVADDELRRKDEEKRQLGESFEDQTRQLERQWGDERLSLQRELQRATSASTAQIGELQERLAASEARVSELKQEASVLRDEVNVRMEKEKALHGNLGQLDDRQLKLQLDLSEREVSIQTLKRSLEQVCQAHTQAQTELESTRQSLTKANQTVMLLQQKTQQCEELIIKKDADATELRQQARDLEQTALGNTSELHKEIVSLRDKLKAQSNELHNTQQQFSVFKAESERALRQREEEQAAVQRDLLIPLRAKMENLVSNNDRFVRELNDKDSRIHELTKQIATLNETNLFQRSELTSKDRKLQQAAEDLENSSAQILSLRRAQQQLTVANDDNRRSRADIELLNEKIHQLEAQLQSRANEVSDLHDREIQLITEVSTRKSELATLRERYANLESLKSISDQNVSELQVRERDLLDKIEEFRSAQQMMQLCFDKQQEQLEFGRRLRDGTPTPLAPSSLEAQRTLF